MKLQFEWIVVGAGPAGIASVGKLLDAGVNASEIAWIDPQFKVGDFGTTWRYVGSNTPVEYFTKFYAACDAFRYQDASREAFMIDKIAANKNCPLMLAAQPLQWITEQLCQTIKTFQDQVMGLRLVHHHWQLALASGNILQAKKVILAIGSEAKQMNFSETSTKVVSLAAALNLAKLKEMIHADDHVIVFGSAQSAKSVVENLSQLEVKKKQLFYRSENSLTRHFREKELDLIDSLEMTPKNLLTHMPNCTKVIYAIGFERRHIPIAGLPVNYSYHKKTGEIAPGIFGLGIAFPEIMPHELGQLEYRVSAIWPFMKRLNKLLPNWLS